MRAIKILPLFVFLLLFISPVFATSWDSTHLSDDTFTASNHPDTIYGNTSYDNWWALVTVNASIKEDIYMKWTITDLVPYGATITAAKIKLDEYAGCGTGYVAAYNTSLNWSQDNVTYNIKPALDDLISNTSLTGCGLNKEFDVTAAAVYARSQNQSLSIMLRSNAGQMMFVSKDCTAAKIATCSATTKPHLDINYTVGSCLADCGDCGCKAGTNECYVPNIIGSYCDVEDGLPNTIKTVLRSNCTGTTYLTCPNGTVCNQISPQINTTLYPVDVPGEAVVPYCHQCVFMNMKVASYPGASTYTWINVWTNCPANPECNCLGWLCSNNLYEAPTVTDTPYNITTWNAGCFNPTSGYWVNITNSTGGQSTIDTIVNDSCGSACTVGNNTPQTECPVNTTTVCYDAGCSPVQCAGAPSTQCSSNSGGQLALLLAGGLGVTDCGLAQGLLSIIASMGVGFALLYYTRDSEHAGQAFMFGSLLPLVGFTLISWFPAWLMVILIVISAYIMARTLGIGA